VEHTIMGARQRPFCPCSRPVGEELVDLNTEIRERFLEHADEADDIVAAADLGAWSTTDATLSRDIPAR
jgi:hypothetical protein